MATRKLWQRRARSCPRPFSTRRGSGLPCSLLCARASPRWQPCSPPFGSHCYSSFRSMRSAVAAVRSLRAKAANGFQGCRRPTPTPTRLSWLLCRWRMRFCVGVHRSRRARDRRLYDGWHRLRRWPLVRAPWLRGGCWGAALGSSQQRSGSRWRTSRYLGCCSIRACYSLSLRHRSRRSQRSVAGLRVAYLLPSGTMTARRAGSGPRRCLPVRPTRMRRSRSAAFGGSFQAAALQAPRWTAGDTSAHGARCSTPRCFAPFGAPSCRGERSRRTLQASATYGG